jgi:hypothetical protein
MSERLPEATAIARQTEQRFTAPTSSTWMPVSVSLRPRYARYHLKFLTRLVQEDESKMERECKGLLV